MSMIGYTPPLQINSSKAVRRYPVGAELIGNTVSFRVWAPSQTSVSLLLESGPAYPMNRENHGYFRLDMDGIEAGARYRFRLEDISDSLADPASRFQPQGPSGFSMVIDPTRFEWSDGDWPGITRDGQVLYEIHIGTFTPEGTYRLAAEKLPLLKEIGINCLEVMPVNEFCGSFGWGYDGVLPYAPTRLYGEPDDLRYFIDTAHQLGIGVILDVVYNHFGVGDRFRDFAPDYFTDRYWNEWGSSINFDGDNSAAVREFFAKNAAYWIDEYHFDGLRLDATQALFDKSDEHIIAEIAREARTAAGERSILLVAENEPQETRLVRGFDQSGFGLDALWNDDFHHSAMVALTGRNEAYYHDHLGPAQEFVSSAKYGYLFQGQRYDWQDAPRGQPGFDLTPCNFVHFLQNHDQIANSGTGVRMDKLASPARVRALTALLLLGPQTPMLFQGQEFGASSPFYYFADQSGDLVEIVRNGRIDFLKQFPSLKNKDFAAWMPTPAERTTFERSKIDWSERDLNSHVVALHKDLLALRSGIKPVASDGRSVHRGLDGSVFNGSAFLLRFFADQPHGERLLLVNLGADLPVTSLAEPLLSPPAGCQWSALWSSEDIVYGGSGRRPTDLQKRWTLSADTSLLLAPLPADRHVIPEWDSLHAWQNAISHNDA
ncbi:malto-oligosyltrehalose trehalohydrolase [Rhizobium sp. S152]|uniref:malto-oligosyltrehalose trehalohydrolase n=1 Tax=Rhizobium sp. S152 TaxID=3055038 RepID=UPI0025A9D112|nr:malto-oligosyltrehalose trehalohydrolase [Rhizobium sp. S152]MDM9627758.1 malto-oligosyltrehalose trehalohydrolase [Rhizobium sp. S152]